MKCSVAFYVPDEVAEAVRYEAMRQARRPGDILTDFLRWGWPSFVKYTLARDLAERSGEPNHTTRRAPRAARDGATTATLPSSPGTEP